MQLFALRYTLSAIFVMYNGFCFAVESTITPPIALQTESVFPNSPQSLNGTCEYRIINYITHTLPQACLRYSRNYTGSEATTSGPEAWLANTPTRALPSETASLQAVAVPDTEAIPSLDTDSALDESSFLSFEDWKRQTLEKEGLADTGGDERRPQPLKDADKRRGSDGIQDALKALEEDIAIETDFTSFLTDQSKESPWRGPQDDDAPTKQTSQDVMDDTELSGRPIYRSKDAGKTCKERFNFASLDAGGQVMKTNTEAKSASALLKEDRDVYMLNPCQATNKFIIVELSESILVDTVAIANFEFFSSTFRRVRVSVSDRYPTKLDRWIVLGTFEARNSRDIQAFLIEDPRIWARYFRVEFVSHYGNEFYCPISLLRVHGRTMIQDVLSMEESTRIDDDAEDDVTGMVEDNEDMRLAEALNDVKQDQESIIEGLKEAEAAIDDLVRTAEVITVSELTDALNSSQITQVRQWLEDIPTQQMTTPWSSLFLYPESLFAIADGTEICQPSEFPGLEKTTQQKTLSKMMEKIDAQSLSIESFAPVNADCKSEPTVSPTGSSMGEPNITNPHSSYLDTSQSITSTSLSVTEYSSPQPSTTANTSPDLSKVGASQQLNRSSTTLTSHGAQPTTQESFFKTVSKRLQLLEANSTLSLKYIEEQSKILRDAFTKVEKRQLAKTTAFLENLNDTVLDELRKFSQQYDQIWQSTVMELETQRDRSQREIAAVSRRLSMLADELVFQKRMSIVQSVLLLLCLGLVIFSRGFTGSLDTPVVQPMGSRPRNPSDIPYASYTSNPAAQRPNLSPQSRPRLGRAFSGRLSRGSLGSLISGSRENSPGTSFSNESKQENDNRRPKEDLEVHENNCEGLAGSSPQAQDNLPLGGYDDEPAGNYPDFKNNAFWISTESRTFNSQVANNSTRTKLPQSAREHSPYHAGENPKVATAFYRVDELEGAVGLASPRLPSPPPESEKPEFSIARKPLPAIPNTEQ